MAGADMGTPVTRKIGIMGGMFDPVHLGHMQAALAARQHCKLDEVILVPCGNPVHRGKAQASDAQRCDMLRLALAGDHCLKLDTRECESGAPSRTRNTLAALRQEHPEAVLHFILGLDAFAAFASWYKWREIFDLAHVLVLARPGYKLEGVTLPLELKHELDTRKTAELSELAGSKAGRIMLIEAATPELSSTQIKHLIHAGKPVSTLLPAGVAEYIETRHLYR